MSTMQSTEEKYLADVRVGVVGNVDSGKSTLIGVLTSGTKDDGRGLARQKIFIHAHEQGSGRTSTISTNIMGFDKDSKPVHQKIAASAAPAAKNKGWKDVVDNSTSTVTFIDLAGHEKYLKTTIAGLTGRYPDYIIIVVNSLAGVSKMTKEHLGVVLALNLPFCVVVTKIDMCPSTVLETTKKQLKNIIKHPQVGKIPMTIQKEEDIKMCLDANNESNTDRICPIFYLSNVTGDSVDLLTNYMSGIKALTTAKLIVGKDAPMEFHVDSIYTVNGVGIVVAGTVIDGTAVDGMDMWLGPFKDGSYTHVIAKSIHAKRVPVTGVYAGSACTIALRGVKRKDQLNKSMLRRGMVLLKVQQDVVPESCREFTADVIILHHSTTIKNKYQAVIHCGNIRQSASMIEISTDNNPNYEKTGIVFVRSGDRAKIQFRFASYPEYVRKGLTFVFREGTTRGVGKVVDVNNSTSHRINTTSKDDASE
jgi:GTPase